MSGAISSRVRWTSLRSSWTIGTLPTVLDGLRRHQFACIAYNGELKTKKPFEASIGLLNGEYLTLLDFVRCALWSMSRCVTMFKFIGRLLPLFECFISL